VNYWKTSKSSPSTWIEKAKREIVSVGGTIVGEAFVMQQGAGAFMLAFDLDGDRYKILWRVLESKGGDATAAKRQAATALYHDVKNSCVKLRFAGARVAFADALIAPDGRTVGEIVDIGMASSLPRMLQRPALRQDDIIDGDVREIK
jgi:hypothetical protein